MVWLGKMSNFEYSEHAQDMLDERDIQDSWVRQAIDNPDRTEFPEDGTVHYIKPIEAFGNRLLRVVVNPVANPPKVITLFFDHRLRSLS